MKIQNYYHLLSPAPDRTDFSLKEYIPDWAVKSGSPWFSYDDGRQHGHMSGLKGRMVQLWTHPHCKHGLSCGKQPCRDLIEERRRFYQLYWYEDLGPRIIE